MKELVDKYIGQDPAGLADTDANRVPAQVDEVARPLCPGRSRSRDDLPLIEALR